MLIEFGSDMQEFYTIPKHISFAQLAHHTFPTLCFPSHTHISANLDNLQFHKHELHFLYFMPVVFLECLSSTYQTLKILLGRAGFQ